MKLLGPDRFDLTFDARDFKVASTSGETQFTGRSAGRTPKLYVLSAQGRPFYVGVTTQPMRARLRLGFRADGSTGYHGYKWRHSLRRATLDIWYHPRPGSDAAFRELETIEAEAVFLLRSRLKQWPEYQTEIHFYRSKPSHRHAAAAVLNHLGQPPNKRLKLAARVD
jgi:hypothetical protein